jgi:hypothetical protein
MIEVICACGNRIHVQEEHVGLSIKCPKCRKLVAATTLPAPGGVAETIPPPGLDVEARMAETASPAPLAGAKAAPDGRGPVSCGFDTAAIERLSDSVERLVAIGRSLRLMLAVLLALLTAQWVLSFLRK